MLGDVAGVVGESTQVGRFPVEEDGEVGLGEEEKGYEKGGAGDYEGYPFGPVPTESNVGGNPAAGYGGDDWCYYQGYVMLA